MTRRIQTVWSEEERARARDLLKEHSLAAVAKVLNREFWNERSVRTRESVKGQVNHGKIARPKRPAVLCEVDKPETLEENREMEILQHQLRKLKRDNNALKEQLLTENHFIERTRDVVAGIAPPKRYPTPPLVTKQYSPQSLVILVSDCHIGEEIDRDETGLAEYNIDIFEHRMQRYYESIMSIVNRYRLTTPMPDAHIFMLGDMVEGEQIFRGQMARIECDVMEQFFRGKAIISRFVSEISANFDLVRVCCVAGNHGRPGRKGETKFYVNWDYLMYRYMQDALKNHSNITWNIPKSWWTIEEIRGQRFYVTHGDDLVRYMGIPWYSLERYDAREVKMLRVVDKAYDHMVIGHHHTAFEWDCGPGWRIANGAFTSGGIYPAKRLQLMNLPHQWIFGVHNERGITFRYPLKLT